VRLSGLGATAGADLEVFDHPFGLSYPAPQSHREQILSFRYLQYWALNGTLEVQADVTVYGKDDSSLTYIGRTSSSSPNDIMDVNASGAIICCSVGWNSQVLLLKQRVAPSLTADRLPGPESQPAVNQHLSSLVQ
jgi:hypothetical protein